MTLEAHELVSGYGQVDVLRRVSLTVAPNEIVAVVGANGAGKSTLVRTLSGLLATRSGQVWLDGEDVSTKPAHRRARRGLIMVPEGRHLFGSLSVRENVAMGRAAVRTGVDRPDFGDQLNDVFPIIAERSEQGAGLLSGGEQQQVALARALAGRPSYLLLDEPSLGLSPALTTELFRTVGRIREQLGIGILLVEQMVDKALALADRAYVMERGAVVLSGDAAEIAASGDVQRAYLGTYPS